MGSPGGGSAGEGVTAITQPAGFSALDRVAPAARAFRTINEKVAFGAEMP